MGRRSGGGCAPAWVVTGPELADLGDEELRRRLAPKGPGRATLVVTRTAPGPGPEGPGRGGAGPAEQRVVIVVETVD